MSNLINPPKTTMLFFRVTPEQHRLIRLAAVDAGEESVSSWIREVVLAAVQEQASAKKKRKK